MILRSLQCENFRNIINQKINFTDGINVLCGKNAAGKTNAIEAIYLFAAGKSFRPSKETELITHNQSFTKVEIDFLHSDKRDAKMEIFFCSTKARNRQKLMKYQGIDIIRASEFLGIFRAVLFTPDHLNLVKGSPDERRKFIDIAICQMRPKYITLLNDYQRILSQRNAFLRSANFSGKFDETLFEVININLSENAAVITKQRNGFCESLKEKAAKFYYDLTDEKENLIIKYSSNAKCDLSDSTKVKEKYLELFSERKESELKSGITQNGPHRDDLYIFVSKNNEEEQSEEKLSEFSAKAFASQGQQRSCVLALKMSEGEIIKDRTGSYPIFLLDDLFSELDIQRRSFLLEMLKDKQAIITACDRIYFESVKDVNIISVENGIYLSNDQ